MVFVCWVHNQPSPLPPQAQVATQPHGAMAVPPPGQQTTAVVVPMGGGLYPSLEDYMGLNLTGYSAVSLVLS